MNSQSTDIIIAIASVLSVIVTVVYVVLTYKILKSSEISSNEQTRPYVTVSLESKNGFLYLVIENHGIRPAFNMCAKFTPDLDERLMHDKLKKTTKLLQQEVILPKQKFNPVLSFNKDTLHDEVFDQIEKNYAVVVSYLDSNNKQYQEYYNINLDDFFFSEKSMEHTISHNIHEIANELGKIRAHITKQ